MSRRHQILILLGSLLVVAAGFTNRSETKSLDGARTPGGLSGVELVDTPWISGDWVHVFDQSRKITINNNQHGIYLGVASGPLNNCTITIFETGCDRIAEFVVNVNNQQQVMYARVSGFSERVSFDMLPAMFPMAWSDKELLKLMGLNDQVEIPDTRRVEALGLLAKAIDTKGTLMNQDMTFYRPHAFEDEMVDD